MAKPTAKKASASIAKESEFLKPWQKTTLSIIFIYVLTLICFNDIILNNKVFSTGADNASAAAVGKSVGDLQKTEGTVPLWYPYMFSGMPTLASGMYLDINEVPIVKYEKYLNPMFYVYAALKVAYFNRDNAWEIATFFFAGVFMFLLARSLGFGYLISLCAAVSYMFCNFFVASMAAGHGGKVKTIAYIPLILWSVLEFFKNRSLMQWSILGLVMGLFFQDGAHTQIMYYAFLMIGIYCIFYAVENFKENWKSVVLSGSGLLTTMLVGFGFGVLGQVSLLVYSDVTMRALPPAFSEASEMAGSGGMTFDYITMWSFHPLESLTFFVPGFFGLDSPYYWGWMTFTSSAFYFGLLPMLAGIIGLVYRRNTMTKFLAATAGLALVISFGKFFEPFFRLVVSLLPFFEKFRVPSMILVLFIFSFSLLSCYGLDFIFNPTEEEKKTRDRFNKVLQYLLIGAGAVLFITIFFRSGIVGAFSFLGDGDEKRYQAGQLAQLKTMRADILISGLFKFSILALFITGVWYAHSKKWIGASTSIGILLIILAFDAISLNKKVISPKPRTASVQEFPETETVRFLKQDHSNFRIFSLLEHAQSGSPMWGYFGLETIGGYSPAKMRIYQDIIEFSLYKGDSKLPINMNIVNMLNVKYLIADGRLPEGMGFQIVKLDEANKQIVYENRNSLPRAYFAKKIEVLSDRQKIIERLNQASFDPHGSAIVEKNIAIESYDSARVVFSERTSNRMAMNVFVDKPSFLTVSEIYYPHGWKAFVDGKETEIFKTNYILRGIQVPAGNHTIEFVFEPREYQIGIWASGISFFGVMGVLMFSIVFEIRKRKSNKEIAS